MSEWNIFTGDSRQSRAHLVNERLNKMPPWRDFNSHGNYRGETYLASDEEIRLINAALYLRRPVLVTGQPGCGKSSLAYSVAKELGLGDVLKWPINSRTTLTEGLYSYDAISRLRDANLETHMAPGSAAPIRSSEIDRYLQLQWLGTALASPTPRVLLIDEIDKADIDLPNDLLHVLEEGSFVIPELSRIADMQKTVSLRTCENNGSTIEVEGGYVRCGAFPIIIMTSNEERELPLALHRRCLRLRIQPPSEQRLVEIVKKHLDYLLKDRDGADAEVQKLVTDFVTLRQEGRVMANDQLLNLIYLLFEGESQYSPPHEERVKLQELLFRGLEQ